MRTSSTHRLTALLATALAAVLTPMASAQASSGVQMLGAYATCSAPVNGTAAIRVLPPSPTPRQGPTTTSPGTTVVGGDTQVVVYKAALWRYANGTWNNLVAESPYFVGRADSLGRVQWYESSTNRAVSGEWVPGRVLAGAGQYYGVTAYLWWVADPSHFADYTSGWVTHWQEVNGGLSGYWVERPHFWF